MTTKENEPHSQNIDGESGLLFKACPNMIRSRCLILMSAEVLTEVVSISTNSIEDADDTYSPTVKELVSSIRKDGLPNRV